LWDQTRLTGLKCNRIGLTTKLFNLLDIYADWERITTPCTGLDFASVTLTTTSAHVHYELASSIWTWMFDTNEFNFSVFTWTSVAAYPCFCLCRQSNKPCLSRWQIHVLDWHRGGNCHQRKLRPLVSADATLIPKLPAGLIYFLIWKYTK